ncbi:MAG: ATP-dependent sacrificial sulfur transferase LarE [Caldisericia bacterium]|nr:ATP-dependent sacrificial sulfur transferase LarE [Caldisericia bacterium]
MDLNKKLDELKNYLKNLNKVSIAFSGGVDSTFLLKVAHDTLKENIISITIDTEFQKREEIEFVKNFTEENNIKSYILKFNILEDEIIRKNPKDRCYFCKYKIFSEIKNFSINLGFNNILDGTNYDDLSDYRPGLRALKELNIISPLLELKFTKEEIREISKQLNLKTWNKPPESCLATRVPFGEKITLEKLKMIEESENYLKSLGISLVRVRIMNEYAKIEVLLNEIDIIYKNLEKITKKFKDIGFKGTLIDLEGYKKEKVEEKFKWI